MEPKKMAYRILLVFLKAFVMLSCSFANRPSAPVYLVQGERIEAVESNIVLDLKADLETVGIGDVRIISDTEDLPEDGTVFLLGTAASNDRIAKWAKDGKIPLTDRNPGPRGGLWAKTKGKDGREIIVLAGSDVQGLQTTVYDFAEHVIGIDPLGYWTGSRPTPMDEAALFGFGDTTIAPPKVPILCYFENDVDELANYRGKLLEYDWETYTEMINSLVRLGYNAIHLFDMLGRPEFFLRPEYQEMLPSYQVDMEYVDRLIEYAHQKGVKVQIDLALGYQIKPIRPEEANCWTQHKEKWIDTWKFYLEETPLGKADIFSLRPRHQIWDWEYESSCAEDKVEVFNEVFSEVDHLIDTYRPGAHKVLICYSDGMEMFNNGFNPPEDWIIAWSDDGFGEFEYLPSNTRGYDFGTYMHAGFWLNHTVHNPYPKRVDSVMKSMFERYGASSYAMVNGQNFRPFLLNLEAYAEVCKAPDRFEGKDFYREWAERYFGKEAGTCAMASMKWLHKAQADKIGYVQHLWEIKEAEAYLTDSPIKRPGKEAIPNSFVRIEKVMERTKGVREYLKRALAEAEMGLENNANNNFYHSYIYLPVILYLDLVNFEKSLHEMAALKKKFDESGNPVFLIESLEVLAIAREQLTTLYQSRKKGDLDKKWDRWYSPEIRRPNNGFPSFEVLDKIGETLRAKAKDVKNSPLNF